MFDRIAVFVGVLALYKTSRFLVQVSQAKYSGGIETGHLTLVFNSRLLLVKAGIIFVTAITRAVQVYAPLR